MKRRIRVAAFVALLAACCACSGWVGGVCGDLRGRYQRYVLERDLTAPILAAPAFSGVIPLEDTRPGGGVYFVGEVGTREDQDRLRAEVARMLGEPRTADAVHLVSLRERSR